VCFGPEPDPEGEPSGRRYKFVRNRHVASSTATRAVARGAVSAAGGVSLSRVRFDEWAGERLSAPDHCQAGRTKPPADDVAQPVATQRGNSGTAIAGSVASAVKFLVKMLLTGVTRDFTTDLDLDVVRQDGGSSALTVTDLTMRRIGVPPNHDQS
jgi:hypothetical protein